MNKYDKLQLVVLGIQLVSCGLFFLNTGMPYTRFISIFGCAPVLILGSIAREKRIK